MNKDLLHVFLKKLEVTAKKLTSSDVLAILDGSEREVPTIEPVSINVSTQFRMKRQPRNASNRPKLITIDNNEIQPGRKPFHN